MSLDASEPAASPELIEELFSAATELDAVERRGFLDRRCAGQPGLRRDVEELLSASDRATSEALWKSPALVQEARRTAREGHLPFDRLGPYQLLSCIGLGGMGAVYLAEREDDGVRRRVAIKVVPRVLTGADSLARFQQERHILARLEHPNIALMLDAGRTPDDTPYLVMQYVDGQPIDRYAAEKNLPVAGRLALFRAVASAVAYAHARQIIHRDLKPTNILVTEDGVPKLLDFGIARLMGDAQAAAQTAGGAASAMTPGYASPEQIAGMPVTASSDIYSLGVLLYELLTGTRPAPASESGEPARPSSVVRTGARVNTVLDAIVLKALRRDPAERYVSVAEFDEAVADFLQNARAPRWRRIAVPVASLALLASVGLYLRFFAPETAPPRVSVHVVAHKAEFTTRYAFDDQRLFFVEQSSFQWTLAQVPLDGGPVVRIPTPFAVPSIFDISPDRSRLLLGSGLLTGPDMTKEDQELWTMPAAGGVPQRLGKLVVRDAAWSPDGRRLVYTVGPKIYAANADGSGSRLVAEIACDFLDWPRWSPDQKFIRVTANFPRQLKTAIWQVSADGSARRAWLPEWPADRTCCGSWIDGGLYYVFQARVKAEIQIWAYSEGGLLRRRGRAPFQLTAGPNFMGNPVGSLRSSRVYALDRSPLGELDRYDAATGTAAPYLGGISARFCAFSPDGKQMSYVTFPGRQLWRRSVDGREAVQLTRPPFRPLGSRWFPDGRRILIEAEQPGLPSKIFIIPAAGGKPEPVLVEEGTEVAPSLSPDGQIVAFGRSAAFDPPSKVAVYLYDLRTRALSELPGSKGLAGASWSPDGRYIVSGKVFPGGRTGFLLWDFRSRSWTTLLGPQEWIVNAVWSRDSRYFYYGCAVDRMDAICRVSVPDGRVETVVKSWKFHREDTSHSGFAGLAPDGSPLFTQIYKDFDVSALSFDFSR